MARVHWMCEAMTTPAPLSAAVGADGPGAVDTVPRAEYDRLIELLYQIGDVAHDASTGPERPDTYWNIRQMAYGFREHVECVSDSKPTNVHNPESEDTPPHNPVLGPVVGTATVTFDKPFRLEYGKRYVRREGQVSGEVVKTLSGHECENSHPFLDIDNGLTYRPDGAYMSADSPHGLDLIAEYDSKTTEFKWMPIAEKAE